MNARTTRHRRGCGPLCGRLRRLWGCSDAGDATAFAPHASATQHDAMPAGLAPVTLYRGADADTLVPVMRRPIPWKVNDRMIEVNGMAHVILTVSQWEKARAFYAELLPFLGMTKVYDGNNFLYITLWAGAPRSEYSVAPPNT